jgi:hypothetical protein
LQMDSENFLLYIAIMRKHLKCKYLYL